MLAEFARIAGNDYHRDETLAAEVEALADRRIEDLARSRIEPPLCDGPVACEQLDGRIVRRSGSFNVETLQGQIGRSQAPYFNLFPIPHLEKAAHRRRRKTH